MRTRRVSELIPTNHAKAKREALNWTQGHVASLAKVPQPYVSRVERGQSVRREDLVAIAQALGLDPDKLMEEVQA